MHEMDTSNAPARQRAVNRPRRPADRNRPLADRTDSTDDAFLPSLDPGITLLDVEGGRGVTVLQSLVLDHLLLSDGPAFWVDAEGHATTTSLARLAPSRRLLDRVHVARGFTAYQHYAALCDLSTAVNRAVRAGAACGGRADANATPVTPALVVAPVLDARYRREDSLGRDHARTLQARALARLAAYAAAYDAPVLVTRTAADEFTAPVEAAVDAHLRCERTRLGPRFVGDDFETLVYPVGDGAYQQTTFAYWRRVLAARVDRPGRQSTGPGADRTTATDDVGRGVTADGSTAALTANPLLDAWTGVAGTGGS